MVGEECAGEIAGMRLGNLRLGPGGEPVYQPNESLALDDIAAATKVYALTAARILEAA